MSMIGQSHVRTVNNKIRGPTFQVLSSVIGQSHVWTVNSKMRGQTFQVLVSVLGQSRVWTVNNKMRGQTFLQTPLPHWQNPKVQGLISPWPWSRTNETHVHFLLSRTVLTIAHVVHIWNVSCSYAKKVTVWTPVKWKLLHFNSYGSQCFMSYT